MKKNHIFLSFALLILAVFATSCKENPVQQYGDVLVKSKEKARDVSDVAELAGHKQTIEAYKAEKGKSPESLDELEKFAGKTINRDKFVYNPENGTIALR